MAKPTTRTPRSAMSSSAARSMAALAAGAVAGALAIGGAFALRAWARRRDLHLRRTAFGPALVCTVPAEDGRPVRVLRLGGVYQSATYLDEDRFYPPFAYYRAFERIFEAESDGFAVKRALMLGGGGYAWPKWALVRHPDLRLDVVEMDAAVTDIARRWFFLDELAEAVGFDAWTLDKAGTPRPAGGSLHGPRRLGLVQGDGRAFLDAFDERRPRYDAVVNDTFAGKSPVMALSTVEAAQAAKRALSPGGVYAANVVSREEGSDLSFLRAVVGTLRAVFAHVWIVPCSDEDFGGEDNYLVVASDRNVRDSGAFTDAVPFDGDFSLSPLHDGAF